MSEDTGTKLHSEKNRQSAALLRPYMSVRHRDCPSFGGSQNWFGGMLKTCGCGIISAADIAWYLKKEPGPGCMDFQEYEQYVGRLKKYFPMVPFRGMPGFVMTAGFNLYALLHRIGYRAHWGCHPGKLRQRVMDMLKDDIPVPFCIGPCLARILRKPQERGLRLYEKRVRDGKTHYVWTKTVRNHFMVITAVSGNRARISSWGEEYYISLKELERLSWLDGAGLFTNIITIRKTKGKESS